MPLTPGTRLATYEILSPLGAGGTGEVYRARDPRLGREIAVKVLSAESLHDDTARARLLREARLAATLNHPNICSVHEVGRTSSFERAYRLVLGDRFIQVRNTSTYLPQEKNPKGEVHEMRGFIERFEVAEPNAAFEVYYETTFNRKQ